MDIFVRDGNVVNMRKYKGVPWREHVCVKGYTNIERMYSTYRVKYPLRRVGARGAGEWEQIGWDEAIDEITTKWKTYQDESGKDSIFFSKGTGNGGITCDYAERLRSFMGAGTMGASYDFNGFMTVPKYIGSGACYAGNAFKELANADTIIAWAANPSEAGMIDFHHITEAQENGAQLIVIDPIFTTTASKADRFISIRPGTDALLAIGMMQIILRDELQNTPFLTEKTVAPFLVKEKDGRYLRLSDLGEETPVTSPDADADAAQAAASSPASDPICVRGADGSTGAADTISDPLIEGSFTIEGIKVTTAYSLLLERLNEHTFEQIVERTGVSLETIEWLVQQFVAGRTTVVAGFGMDHYVNGITGYGNILTLLQITGQFLESGRGISVVDMSLPMSLGTDTSFYTAPADTKPGPGVWPPYFYDAVLGDGIGDYQPQIRSIYFYCHNMLGNMTERKKTLEALEALDLVVVSDIWMSETANYADIVLPVAFIFEVESIQASFGNPYIRLQEQAVPPQFESKSDFDIITLLGRGMGFEGEFQATVEEYLENSLDNDLARGLGVSWEGLKEEKRLWANPPNGFVHGLNGLSTPTGRLQFYLEDNAPLVQAGKPWDAKRESLPYWEPPNEAWYENEKFGQFPLVFMSERSKFKTHTMFTYTPTLLEIDPEPYIKVSSTDAESRGIKTGDTVRVFNDRGYVVIKAVVNPGVRPGVIVIDHGWQQNQFIEGHYSDLSSRTVSIALPGPAWFDCLCQVEKVG
jgi:molybdopterin-containing oxidoreductase family molybdopterin binding subunit